MKEKKIDILFLDGLEAPHINPSATFLTYLYSLASVLEQNKFTFKILNITTIGDYSLKGIINCLKQLNFSVIGMTTNVDNIRFVHKIVDVIKEHFPDVAIILGGSQVTFSDIKTLNECKCDVVVRSEGEESLINLLNYYINNVSDLENIRGITFRKNGHIERNLDGALVDINNLPTPQYAIIKDKRYWVIPDDTPYKKFDHFLNNISSMNSIFTTGRGCPYRCAFCVEGNLKLTQRKRSTEKVIQDFKYFLEIFDTPYIIIGDDTFTSSPKRVTEVCHELKKLQKKKSFIWFAEGRVDVLSRNLDLIPMMRDAGLYKLQLGVESGSQEILDIYKKGIKLDQIETVVNECSKYDDMLVHGNFILGNPEETMETFKESIKFAKKLIDISDCKMDLSCGYLAPFVGTPIRENPEKFGLEILYDNFEFEKTAFATPICKPVNMTLEDLNKLNIEFESETFNYYRDNIWNLPKQRIDQKVRFDKKFGGGKTGVIARGWGKTFYRLLTLQRYYNLLDQDSSVETLDNSLGSEEIRTLCPLRLWDLDFDSEVKEYKFISFKNEQIVISGKESFLWEMASGKNTIEQIVNHSESPFVKGINSLNYVFNFYQQLEDKFALIFRAF